MAPKLSKNKGGKTSKSDRDEGLSASEDHEEVKLAGVTQTSEAESSDAETSRESNPANLDNIFQAIISLKSEFSAKFESVLTILTDVKNQIGDCSARLTEAEERISQTEDTVDKLQSTAKMLEDKIKLLSAKTEDLENRSRRSNVQLVGLPEKAKGRDACGFLENWLPDALGMEPLRSPLIIERAHRIASVRSDDKAPPRALIMKFLNYKDKVRVLNAAREKKEVLYKGKRVMLFPDFSAEVSKKRQRYNEVKKKLRAKGLDYRFLFPSRLQVSFNGTLYTFENPGEVETFLDNPPE